MCDKGSYGVWDKGGHVGCVKGVMWSCGGV